VGKGIGWTGRDKERINSLRRVRRCKPDAYLSLYDGGGLRLKRVSGSATTIYIFSDSGA